MDLRQSAYQKMCSEFRSKQMAILDSVRILLNNFDFSKATELLESLNDLADDFIDSRRRLFLNFEGVK